MKKKEILEKKLLNAAKEGQVKVVEKLLESGVNPMAMDMFGKTALHCGAESGNLDVVRLLLNSAVNISANPQVSNGAFVGQALILVGRSDTNTITLEDGDGLSLNGTIELFLNSVIELIWSGSVWLEKSRKE